MMGYNGSDSNKLTETVRSADKTLGRQAKVLQESTSGVNGSAPAIDKSALAATEPPVFKPDDDPTKENKNESIIPAQSSSTAEHKGLPPCRRRRCRTNLPRGDRKKKPRIKKEEEFRDPPPGSPWNIEDEHLPEPLKYDKFEIWPDGDVQRIHRDYEIRINGLDNGWVMQDTSSDNPNIISKSCMGVLICSENCTSSGSLKAYKPAACDKHRKKQIGLKCSTPGCEGRLILIPCVGNNGLPVTQLWRYYKDRVYFQSKGRHNHARPERKTSISPMAKGSSSVEAQPSVTTPTLSRISTTSPITSRPFQIQSNLEINRIAAIVDQLRQPQSLLLHINPIHSQQLAFSLTPQSNSTNIQAINLAAETKNANSEKSLSADESFHATKSPKNVLSQCSRNTSHQKPLFQDNSSQMLSVKHIAESHGSVSIESPLNEKHHKSKTEAQNIGSQSTNRRSGKQESTKLSLGNGVGDSSETKDVGSGTSPEAQSHRKTDSSSVESLLQQSSSSHLVPSKAPSHPFMIAAILRVPFESKSTEESMSGPSFK